MKHPVQDNLGKGDASTHGDKKTQTNLDHLQGPKDRNWDALSTNSNSSNQTTLFPPNTNLLRTSVTKVKRRGESGSPSLTP